MNESVKVGMLVFVNVSTPIIESTLWDFSTYTRTFDILPHNSELMDID